MADVKPIETIYNGYRFRSRLEARWAVYFDLIGIKYNYEPNGFVLSNGKCYLPDFYLPTVEAYVEIKPNGISDKDLNEAADKLTDIAYFENKYALLCVGDPVDNNITIWGMIENKNGYGYDHDIAEFIIGAEKLDDDCFYVTQVFNVGIVVGERHKRNITKVAKPDGTTLRTVQPFNLLYGFDRIPYEAQERARQARFEHGECG